MIPNRFRPAHEFLRSSLFYPLALSSTLCGTLIVGRVTLSQSWAYSFLVKNLFLAWLPYLFSLWAVSSRPRGTGRGWQVWPAGVLWVLFLPNAPYIVTDFKHLLDRREFPLMYDIVLIFAFAWTGLLLGLTSLHLMQGMVRAAWGRMAAGGFVVAITLLTAVGIYVGRFLRWNSWDVLARPGTLLTTLAGALRDPMGHSRALGHVLVFATVMLLCHLTFMAFRDAGRPR